MGDWFKKMAGMLKQYGQDAMPGGALNKEVTPENVRMAAELASMTPNPIGDVASLGLAADDVRRGNYGDAALNAVGVLPFVPAMGGLIKDIPAPKWLKDRVSIPVGINPTQSELAELFRAEKQNSGYQDLRVLRPEKEGGTFYMWPASDALHQDVGAFFKLKPSDYKHQQWSKD